MKNLLWVLLLFVCGVVSSTRLHAQIGGKLEGVVTDSSKAVVAGATVSVTNTETGISRVVTTDAQGRYAFNALPPARYDLSVAMPGFKTTLRQGITLALGAEMVLDQTLEVGAVAEQITVTGEAPLVETREMFNLANHSNFSSPTATIFQSATSVNASNAGRITTTRTSSRQMQFALKYIF